jgi:NDP-sugar pyrophosphorylase family protein
MHGPTLVILAAGTRSRYGSLKTFDPVGPEGEALIEYSVFDAHRAGFRRFVFVIRPDIEQPFREMVQARLVRHVSVDYVFQKIANLPPGFHVPAGRTRPWGTTHAILAAEHAVREPFGVINSDDFYGAESYRTLARHLGSSPDSHPDAGATGNAMVGFVLRNTLPEIGQVARAVCRVNAAGMLEKITELKNIERDGGHARNVPADGEATRLDGGAIVSMNMWGFSPQIFAALSEAFRCFLLRNGADATAESYIPNAIDELLAEHKVKIRVLPCAESWFGVTYPDDHSRAASSIRRLVESGYYPKRLWR